MINAIVQNRQGENAVIDLTVHYHEIYKELQSLGYYGSPERLLLRDEEDEEYSVKLYSDSNIGNSMILLLNERDSLYDAYLLDLAVTNAREEIKTDLEQNLLHGQYSTFSEVLDDINQMKIAAAETIQVHVAACLYGEGEPFNATPEEIAYLTRRAEADDNFFYGHCKNAGHSDFTFTWLPEELYGMEME